VTVNTTSGTTLLCLELREETLLVIPSAAKFRALIVFTANNAVEVDIEDGFTASTSPAVYLGAAFPNFTTTSNEAITEYTASDWAALELAIDPRFYRPGPGVLHELDTTTFEIVDSVTLPGGVRPVGGLTAWEPAP
jgi:hypothetical protein